MVPSLKERFIDKKLIESSTSPRQRSDLKTARNGELSGQLKNDLDKINSPGQAVKSRRSTIAHNALVGKKITPIY